MHRLLVRSRHDRGAATLELVAVMTILGGVSALAITSLSPLSADAVDVACRASEQTVRMAASAYATQSRTDALAPDVAALVTAGYLPSVLPDVSYAVTGSSFEVRGTGPCTG